jgi:hypothetical protein
LTVLNSFFWSLWRELELQNLWSLNRQR